MFVGYARVSSAGQSLDVQLEKLKSCEKVFQEKQSGRSAQSREQLQMCLDFVREGDTLIITKLDRLCRSTIDLLQVAQRLEAKGVSLRVLDQNIDTATPAGKLMFTMLGAIAEFENDLRRERQADGIALARSRGLHLGRRAKLSSAQVSELRSLRQTGVKIRELMERFSLSKASVYRLLDAPTT
jgi:DNA invertase Pin-like site-specific DNA recombinase